jgi:DNA topoisomerase-2
MSTRPEDYNMMTQRQHIYEVTDTYVGSDEQVPRTTSVLTVSPLAIVDQTITLPVAVERLFIEILSNASDNVDRSRRANVDPGTITVHVDANYVLIRNGGLVIPITIHPTYNIHTPELIFGNLLTSSNYSKEVDRTGCGRNGYGAKLVNIFSKLFVVEVGDPSRGLKYSQTWEDNMGTRHDPIIESYQGPPYVQICYLLDFERFGYQHYPDEAIALFGRHAADTSLTMSIPVTFNGMKLTLSKPNDYAKLLFPQGVKHLTHSQPGIELCILDTVGIDPVVVSSINGMMTPDGGVHVEAAYKAISEQVLPIINGSKPTVKLTLADVKAHLSMILVCHLPNPKFNSQIKTKLTSPTPKITLDPKAVKKMLKWDFVNHLYAVLEMKQSRAISKTDGKKTRFVDIDKAEDANLAGTKDSYRCTLFVVEGKSAKGYANCLQTLVERGRDVMGIYPMKGKPLNVMNADFQQIAENQELKELKEILGLKEGVDYTDERNFRTLRYGYFVILTDADDDGKHITGLILNLFYCRYPSLLARGFVMLLRTPIIRVRRGKERLKFYSQQRYTEWKDQTPDYAKWDHKYYKGLATSKKEEVREDYTDPKTAVFLYDDQTPDSINLAFNKKLSHARKEWLEKQIPSLHIEEVEALPISDFINYEFVRYSLADLARSIPRAMDGLKVSQRKAVWAALIKWKRKKPTDKDEFKVARFASFVAEQTSYHHGENCMSETIVSMAQDFVGANNLPFFCQDGQFGSRNDGGKDAGNPRYIYTKPSWWLPLIFRQEDDPLLERVVDEGEQQEPLTFYPIIPLALVNGMNGIGTGYSTFIPNHNPLDLIAWIRCRLRGSDTPQLVPWYRGFTGTIRLEHHGEVASEQDDDRLGPDTVVEPSDRLSVVISGRFHVDQGNVVVTELPIGRSMHDYKNWLDDLRKEKKIASYANNSTDVPHFTITGFANPSLKSLRLVRTFGMSNMVLLDERDRPRRYPNTDAIMEEFVAKRVLIYEKRRHYLLDKLKDKITVTSRKAELIKAIVDQRLVVFGRAMSDVLADADRMGLDGETFKSLTLTSCTRDKIDELEATIRSLQEEHSLLDQKSPGQMWLEDLDEFEDAYRKHEKL